MGCNLTQRMDTSIITDEELALYTSKCKSDIWSAGIILLEMALGMEILSESRTKLCSTLRKVMSWVHAEGCAVERIVQDLDAVDQWKVCCLKNIREKVCLHLLKLRQGVQPELKEVIESCLQILPEDRPSTQQLLNHRLFTSRTSSARIFKFPVPTLPLELQRIHQLVGQRPLYEVCHLWHLVGGDVEAELRKSGILRNKPAIFSLPW